MAYRSTGNGYVDVANHYREKIENGELSAGDSLPGVEEICSQFNVSSKTVSRALKVLKDEGLVAHRGALGTAVTERPRVAPVSGAARVNRTRNGGPNYSTGETSTGHLAQIRSLADPGLCRELGLEPHDEVLIRKRVFRVHGVPQVIGLEVIHLRALQSVPSLEVNGPRGPVHWFTEYEETTGKRISASPEMRAARLAARDELDDLEIQLPDADVAIPVLITRTTWHDEDGPIEVMEDIYTPGAWHAAKS